MPGTRTCAVFDFDGTLTTRDTLLGVFRRATSAPRRELSAAIFIVAILLFWAKLISNHAAKAVMLQAFLRGVPVSRLDAASEQFADEVLPKIRRDVAWARLRRHLADGHRVIISSASLEPCLERWFSAPELADVEILATRIEVEGATLTGRMIGRACYGDEKVRRLRELIGDPNDWTIHAYGDSAGDEPLLRIADHPHYRHF